MRRPLGLGRQTRVRCGANLTEIALRFFGYEQLYELPTGTGFAEFMMFVPTGFDIVQYSLQKGSPAAQ
jgi:hypothetical protein